ncbi:hypothetical protein CS542_08770 [Pedobacter sp. IW39]|nr:hypothetical protein CS542_08770 [Pedobacter sp. IW39]
MLLCLITQTKVMHGFNWSDSKSFGSFADIMVAIPEVMHVILLQLQVHKLLLLLMVTRLLVTK